jgi:hypothetical protein
VLRFDEVLQESVAWGAIGYEALKDEDAIPEFDESPG